MDVDLNDADEVGSMRVLVVDDHQAFRHALTSALSMVDDIEEMRPSKVSIMPAGLDKVLTSQELADLVAFLKACK